MLKTKYGIANAQEEVNFRQCPFVSVSEEESEAQHAFCNVKEKEVPTHSPRSHSSHSLFPSFTSTNTRRFSVVLQLRSHPHPCGFEVVLYGCSLGAREAV